MSVHLVRELRRRRDDDQVDAERSSRRPSATTRRGTGATATSGRTSPRAPTSTRARSALILDDRAVTYEELRRAAIGVSQPARGRRRPARRGRDPARPPLDRGRGRDARVPAPRRGARAAAADVQRRRSCRHWSRRRRRDGARRLRRREGDREVRGRSPTRSPVPAGGRARARRRAGARGSAGRARATRTPTTSRMVLHSSGTTSAPKGIVALQQHPALRDRGGLPALGADRRGHLPRRVRVRLRRRSGLRLLPAAAQRRDRRAREPLEAPRTRCG